MGMKDVQPGAGGFEMVDYTRSRFGDKLQYTIATGANIVNEGTFLVKADGGNNEEVVSPCTGAADEIFAGIAQFSAIEGYIWAACQNLTIPNVAAPTIDLGVVNLLHDGSGPPPLAEARVIYTATGVAFTILPPGVPPAGAGDVEFDYNTGIMTFHAADASVDITVTYRWNLTAQERDMILRESGPNRGCESMFGIMSVGLKHCYVYTMMYDARANWVVDSVVPADQPVLGANGKVSTVALEATGTLLPAGRVFKAPEPGDPYLGIEFNV